MTIMRKMVMMVAAVGLPVTYAATVAASECEADSDCGPGFVCETYELVHPTCSEPRPDCGDFGDCDEQGMAPPECDDTPVVEIRSYCARAACEVDADCGEEMICVEHVSEWCSGSDMVDIGCDEGDDCAMPVPAEECGTDIYRECGYPYEAPCEVDADCGGGFLCVAQEVCTCSDYAGPRDIETGGGQGDNDMVADPMPVEEEECSCEPTGERYCQLQDISCVTDADCPAGLSCAAHPGDTDCVADEDGRVECTEHAPVYMCTPDGWDRSGSYPGEGKDEDIGAPAPVEDSEGSEDMVWFEDMDLIFGFGCSVASPAAGSATRQTTVSNILGVLLF